MWNKNNISHLFREARQERRERVDIWWKARSGATFRVMAHDLPRARGPNVDGDKPKKRQQQEEGQNKENPKPARDIEIGQNQTGNPDTNIEKSGG